MHCVINNEIPCSTIAGPTIATSYYTLMIWFPELFHRYEEFESLYPGKSASVCEVSSVVLPTINGTQVTDLCSSHIDNSVYLHTIIIGAACIPTSFWLPLCVHKLGAKFFLGIPHDSCCAMNPNVWSHHIISQCSAWWLPEVSQLDCTLWSTRRRIWFCRASSRHSRRLASARCIASWWTFSPPISGRSEQSIRIHFNMDCGIMSLCT